MLRIGIVVGEPSGDTLGAGLLHEIKRLQPNVQIEGILGPRIRNEGGVSLFPMSCLSVMGITEVAKEYLELVSIRNRLKKCFLNNPPDIFIGIDAPEFNLGLEKDLRDCGIKTVHYVSPSIWAWRRNRVHKVAESADLLLTLFPFEAAYYTSVNLEVRCVGHPLAQSIPLNPNTIDARRKLGIDADKTTIAIMPGSRKNEVNSLSVPFINSAKDYLKNNKNIQFISSFIDKDLKECFEGHLENHAPDLPIIICLGRTHDALEACDIALLTSGTIALEAMLYKKPMIIAYKTSSVTYSILRLLVTSRWISLPNILAQKGIIPELLQNAVTVENIINELQKWVGNKELRHSAIDEFYQIHEKMRMETDKEAAEAVLNLCA